MAKPGGKVDSKRKAKRAEKEKGKPRSVRPAAAKASKALKTKAAKPKPVKGTKETERLVERVASEIIVAELDRAVAESVTQEAVTPEAPEAATPEAEAKPEPKSSARRVRQQKPEPEPEKEKEEQQDESSEPDEELSDAVFGDLLRLSPGPVDLAAFDPASTPGASSKARAEAQLPKLAERLGELQERLFAAARGGDSKRRVLLVLQGMDTSGKGGTVRHVVGQLDPNGTRLTAFKAPTEEERAHDFLWRIRNALPTAGEVGIFDRSHYEDVLIARVRKLALPMVIGKRYQLINKFEQNLVADGAVVVKCFLHISAQEQKERLLTRLDDPRKHWKYNPGDVDERALWPQYQEAYRIALEKCTTEAAPWHVIPANHKWYRNYAITRLLVEALERIDPQYPSGGFDVEVERKRVLAS